MIITKTPLRISFAGGGSDLPLYYKRFGGSVLSVSINKYIYISMQKNFNDDEYSLKYFQNEYVHDPEQIKHPIIREVLKFYDIRGIDLTSSSVIPSGTGLGSSSAFTVGLINLCNVFLNKTITKTNIANLACQIEIEKLQNPIGKQDQYACTFGGLNFIEFQKNNDVIIKRLNFESQKTFEKNLLMFYTGQNHNANNILGEQCENLEKERTKIDNLHKIVQLSEDLRAELLNNNLDSVGEILNADWNYKKELTKNISNSKIDKYYDIALKNGADGGKLLGAGGGGFLLFYSQEKNHEKLRKALKDLKEIKFLFDDKGTQTVYNDLREA